MFQLTIILEEFFDDETNEFVTTESKTYELEHSLFTISIWESKWKKPFLSNDEKSEKKSEELIDYIKIMSDYKLEDHDILKLTKKNIDDVSSFIDDPSTATWFSEDDKKSKGRTRSWGQPVITSELIYYWMVSHNIPFSCERWHLKRLLTLIRVCNVENQPKEDKKLTREDLSARHRLNQERRARYGGKG